MVYKTLSIFIVICSIAGAWQVLGGSAKEKEKWIEPNAWAREVDAIKVVDDGVCTCNIEGNNGDVSENNQAATFVLKKFLLQLFSREKLQYDEQYSLYQRNLRFTILPEQLEKLEKLDDPRDLDSVLTEIFENVRTSNDNNNSGSWTRIFALIWDIVKDCVLLLRFSEVRFISIVILIIIAGWFIHRKHNISILLMMLSGLFIFGYFHTYLECNRELEMKQMIDAIEHSETVIEPYVPRWYSPITNWFGSTQEEIVKKQRREKIQRESRLNLSFCRPDHVLIMYMNDIFIKQLEFLVEKCMATIFKVKGNLGYIEGTIAVAGLLSLLIMLIKLSFEHVLSPRVWVGYFRRNDTHADSPRDQQQALTANNEDRLSGENLKILLKAISVRKASLEVSIPTVSCVQDVLESIEGPTTQSDNSSSSSSSSSFTSVNSKSVGNLSHTTISALISEAVLEPESRAKFENQSDDFVMVSEVKSKVLLGDLPTDHE